MTTVPDTPRLRDVLERGGDPAEVIGYDHLLDVVVGVVLIPLEAAAISALDNCGADQD